MQGDVMSEKQDIKLRLIEALTRRSSLAQADLSEISALDVKTFGTPEEQELRREELEDYEIIALMHQMAEDGIPDDEIIRNEVFLSHSAIQSDDEDRYNRFLERISEWYAIKTDYLKYSPEQLERLRELSEYELIFKVPEILAITNAHKQLRDIAMALDPSPGMDYNTATIEDLTVALQSVYRDTDVSQLTLAELAELTGDTTAPRKLSKPRPTRPSDASELDVLDTTLHLWNHTHLTSQVMQVYNSPLSRWTRMKTGDFDGYALETDHGVTTLPSIQTEEALKDLIRYMKAEGLQYLVAGWNHTRNDILRRHNGQYPKNWQDVKPTLIIASDLLRSMGRTPSGHSFHKWQQKKAAKFLMMQNNIEYPSITPTIEGKSKPRVGPILRVIEPEYGDIELPFDHSSRAELIGIWVYPSQGAYDLMRQGKEWAHPKIMEYHSNNQKYEICIGVYIGQIQMIRRNKPDQEFIRLDAIDEGAALSTLDSNKNRRFDNILDALNRLAQDGVIPGDDTSKGKGFVRAIIDDSLLKNINERNTLNGKKKLRVKIVHPAPLPNGYKPLLSSHESCNNTSITPTQE
jgi:hypothetical protein